MGTACRALLWNRLDTVGTDLAFVDGGSRFINARGFTTTALPVPHVCRYELVTDAECATTRLHVSTEGAGWRREVRLDRSDSGWRITTTQRGTFKGEPPGMAEPGLLRDALDVDLEATVLTNSLPIRRLRLLGARPGTAHPLLVAFIRVPSLLVSPVRQIYTVVTDGMVRYTAGSFTADLSIDENGYVTHYPGYAARVTAGPGRG